MKTSDYLFLSSSFGRISRFKSSMSFWMSQDVQSRVWESQNIHESAEPSRSDSFPSQNLRLSANFALSVLPTNAERKDSFPISRQSVPTDLSFSSLFAFSRTYVQAVCTDAMTSEGSEARVGRASGSVGATIGGPVVLLLVAMAVLIVIHRKRWRSEAIDDKGSGADIDMVETMSGFGASDRYVSQENTDQIRTEELVRLSLVIE
jgi:hypothetical protein